MPLGANKAAIMGVAGTAAAASVVLIQTQTASDDATIDFESGIDSTYGEYIIRFYNVNNSVQEALQFQVNASGQSGYNETMTTSFFRAFHNEPDSQTGLAVVGYHYDQGNGTAYQPIGQGMLPATAYANISGELHIFNPSSTTYAKHFYGVTQTTDGYGAPGPYAQFSHFSGYINVTAAITNVSFKYGSGNITAGKFKMWGVL